MRVRITAGRTALFAALSRMLRPARGADQKVKCARATADDKSRLSRRSFLGRAAGASALLGIGAPLLSCGRTGPRVVIVGAGLAGLVAANTLRKDGIVADVFEADDRPGGRVRTAVDMLSPDIVSELGGEFIGSAHDDILRLAEMLGLRLLDRTPAADAARVAYFFEGRHYSEAQIAEEFRLVAPRIQADADAAGAPAGYRDARPAARQLDEVPLSLYLDRIGCRGWLRQLIEVAFVAEFGMDAEQQSALNLVHWAGGAVSRGAFVNFRDSDARFAIQGGNEQLTHALAERVPGQIRYGTALRVVRARDRGYLLTFDLPEGSAEDVRADIVVLALPFSALREVKLDLPLPDAKRKAIEELGYGTHARLVAGFADRAWRRHGYGGELLTDAPLQHCWDHTQGQNTTVAGVTFNLAGRPGLEVVHDSAEQQVRRLLVGMERAFPGARAAYADRVERFHWPSYPHAKGSIACYKPGQWTRYAGIEGEPVGGMYFAGEQCVSAFRGTMNGAVQSGRRVAEAILARVRNNA